MKAIFKQNSLTTITFQVQNETFFILNFFLVQLNWNLSPKQYLSSPLVRGQPYMTLTYNQLTPMIGTQHAIISVNGNYQPGIITDSKFKIELNNGQTWVVYALNNQSITFSWSVTGLTSNNLFTGTLRAALLLNDEDESTLDSYVNTYATGASVTYQVEPNSNKAIVEFDWATNGYIKYLK